MAVDPDLAWLGSVMGAEQVFSDQDMISFLCPHLGGKTLAQLTPAELEELMLVARSFPLSKLTEEEED